MRKSFMIYSSIFQLFKNPFVSYDFNINIFNPRQLTKMDELSCHLAGIGLFLEIVKPTWLNPNNQITSFYLHDQIRWKFSTSNGRWSGVVDHDRSENFFPCYFINQFQNVCNNPSRFAGTFGDDDCVDDFVGKVSRLFTNEIYAHQNPCGARTLLCFDGFLLEQRKSESKEIIPRGLLLAWNMFYQRNASNTNCWIKVLYAADYLILYAIW